MAKYYIASGDLERILSVDMTAKEVARMALDEFITKNKDKTDMSVATKIGVSQRGFRHPDSDKVHTMDDAIYFDVLEILETIE